MLWNCPSFAGRTAATTVRTLCQPVFTAPDIPINVEETWADPPSMGQADFESHKTRPDSLQCCIVSSCLTTVCELLLLCVVFPRPVAKGKMCAQEDVWLVATDQGELWLLNTSNEERSIGPAELFGFNVGSFADKPTGLAATFVCNVLLGVDCCELCSQLRVRTHFVAHGR